MKPNDYILLASAFVIPALATICILMPLTEEDRHVMGFIWAMFAAVAIIWLVENCE